MKIADLLCESFPYPPGSDMPPHIIDLRDPTKAEGQYRSYTDPRTGKKVRYWDKQPKTYVVLATGGKVIVYFYGDHNTIPWRDVVSMVSTMRDPVLTTSEYGDQIAVKGTGYLFDRGRQTGIWAGDRSRYSSDIRARVAAMVERGIATPDMPIWIGNTAGLQGEHIGSVGSILARPETPSRVMLYHGTSSYRLTDVQAQGLVPQPLEARVWNKGSMADPERRGTCVYLTASLPQAEYYAMKAVNTDRARTSGPKRYDIERKIAQAERSIPQMEYQLSVETNPYRREGLQDLIAQSKATVADTKPIRTPDGVIQPVILQVTLGTADMRKLVADDDYMNQDPTRDPADWQDSLSHFGQVAYRGTIPASRVRVIAQGNDAKRKSR